MKSYLTKLSFKLFASLMATSAVLFVVPAAHAVTSTTTATSTIDSLQNQINLSDQQINALNQQIATYQAQLKQIGADKRTLQQAINALNLRRSEVEAQVNATQYQIKVTELQIQQSGVQIANAEQEIATDQATLEESLRLLQTTGDQSLLVRILSSGTITEAWNNTNAVLELQNNVQNNIQMLQQQEQDLANIRTTSQQKQVTLTSQQQSLTSQQQSLMVTAQSKAQLLQETNAQQSNYEQLLAAAEAEIHGFSTFSTNAGGSKLIQSQTACDSWGCYYNQRDALWGNDPLNGTRYDIASDGCLITALAMVMTHYGYRDVTPVTINVNPDNFASYYPASLLTTIHVNGMTVSRVRILRSSIDGVLATGNPLIVGLRAYGGTHFVVLVSGKKGNYLMRDPYVPYGDDISFSSKYSLRDIFSVAKVVISS
jgi:peptidoglycan hydrolase CwlO-like protein